VLYKVERFIHSSGGLRAWHLQLLDSREDVVADSIIRWVHLREREGERGHVAEKWQSVKGQNPVLYTNNPLSRKWIHPERPELIHSEGGLPCDFHFYQDLPVKDSPICHHLHIPQTWNSGGRTQTTPKTLVEELWWKGTMQALVLGEYLPPRDRCSCCLPYPVQARSLQDG
jgi:hypothetical protein